MYPDHVELDYRGKTIKAACRPGSITTAGEARLSYAAWEVDVGGAQYPGFPGDWTDKTEESVKARLREWADARPDLFAEN
jgi:hypothetical protein